MRFEDKLKNMSQQQIWDEYCGFLDLNLDEYMAIQERLLKEQLDLLSTSPLGKRFLGDKVPKNSDEFRKSVPLTTYDNYADILLMKRDDMLPAPPVLWLSTTWEGGDTPFKSAPYSQAMLDVYKSNILACMILSTSTQKGSFRIKPSARVLYSLAPLPYASGLFPGLVDPEISINFLPSLRESKKLSFSQRCKKGFKLSLRSGMDQFYGMTSIVYNMSKSFGSATGGGRLKDLLNMSPTMLYRFLRAKYFSKRDGVPIKPGDIFHLDGFVCVGTDSAKYKDELEKMWNRRPLELWGGTEPCLLATETWKKDGLVFFPDNCFYEFIPEDEMQKSINDNSYTPSTYLMNELVAGEKYELVITVFKGGAFVRYRVGDIFRCLRMKNAQDGLALPQFEYVDRVPTVIDIDGFTRITEKEINKVISLSGLNISDWIAYKDYDDDCHSYLQMFIELSEETISRGVVDAQVLKEHLSIYFRCYDGDYNDLKRLIGVDPLRVTVLKTGTISSFESASGRSVSRLNARRQDMVDLIRFSSKAGEVSRFD